MSITSQRNHMYLILGLMTISGGLMSFSMVYRALRNYDSANRPSESSLEEPSFRSRKDVERESIYLEKQDQKNGLSSKLYLNFDDSK